MNKKRTADPERAGKAAEQPSLDELRAGSSAPSAEQMGHRVDLPDAMREKMESAFGADLSAVKLYESEAVRDAGIEAVTQGSNIAFAPGMLDFTSFSGQALLGHEISHVVSQARGEVTGSGLLNDHALEARADREGAMAAAGQQISVPAEAMSAVSAAPASGPMQCKGKKASEQKIDELQRIGTGIYSGANITAEDRRFYDDTTKNLSKQEIKMIRKRQQQALRNQYSWYKSMAAAPPNRNIGYAMNLVSAGREGAMRTVYGDMLNAHISSNNFNPKQIASIAKTARSPLTIGDRRKERELDSVLPDLATARTRPDWQAEDQRVKHEFAHEYNHSRRR